MEKCCRFDWDIALSLHIITAVDNAFIYIAYCLARPPPIAIDIWIRTNKRYTCQFVWFLLFSGHCGLLCTQVNCPGMKLTTHPHQMPMLRVGIYSTPPPMTSWHAQGQFDSFTFYVRWQYGQLHKCFLYKAHFRQWTIS